MAIARDTLQKKSLRFPDSEVLYDYDFLDSPELHGFEQLYSGHYEPPIGWDRKGMWIGTENVPGQIATAIKRNTYYERFNHVRLEAWVSLAQWYGDANIRGFEMGIDQANNAGLRRYFSLRRVFTRTGGATQPTNRWDVKTGGDLGGNPSYTILPGHGTASGTVLTATTTEPTGYTPQWPTWTTNENKRNTMYLAMDIDPARGCYLGVRFQDYALGTCRDSGEEDPTMTALLGQDSNLPRFANGLNVSFDLRAQLGGVTATGADAYIERVRLSGRKVA
jgi:hypothetical protein